MKGGLRISVEAMCGSKEWMTCWPRGHDRDRKVHPEVVRRHVGEHRQEPRLSVDVLPFDEQPERTPDYEGGYEFVRIRAAGAHALRGRGETLPLLRHRGHVLLFLGG